MKEVLKQLLEIVIFLLKPLEKVKPEPKPEHNRNERLLIRASQDIGIKEIKGPKSNKVIEAYYPYARVDNDPTKTMTDDVPFCSAAMCAWVEQVGMGSTNSLLAKSWLKWGVSTKKDPLAGDIIIFDRGSWKGHVGIFLGYTGPSKKYVYCLGANQNDSVNVTKYSVNRLMDYRRSSKMKKLTQKEKDQLWAMANSIIKTDKVNLNGRMS